MKAAAILIVEDEAIVALDLKETLVDMGYDPFAVAATAEEALSRAASRCPDIVLMDIRIKGDQDGVEVARLLRERFDVPIVYLTAHADEATIRRAKETEPYGYLSKPVKPADLRSAIEITLYRHQMERRLRERERWFSTTLSSIADAVITVDMSGVVTFMNPAAELLVGVPAQSAIGRPARDVVRLLDPARPASPLDEVLAHGRPIRIDEASLQHASDAGRIISDSTAPVIDEGEMLGAVMVFRDVTEQKLSRRQLEVTDRLASLGTMAAGVAHEINNPLAVMLGNASFVLTELEARRAAGDATEGTAMLVDAVQEIEGAGARVARIVSDLQSFARPASPSPESSTDVLAAVTWAVRATAHAFRSRPGVEVNVEPDLRVGLDETRLGQVLVNLLSNAAHALAGRDLETPGVHVSATSTQDMITIQVQDAGSGIPPEILQRIFEPFFTTKEVGVGTGLGLAICHGIIVSAGGRIDVTSDVGVGTCFRISLPRHRAVAPPEPATSPPTPFKRGRILVIDDEASVLKAISRMLRDHEVVTVSDGNDALAILRTGTHFDLVLSDMMMPIMTGMELYERLLVELPAIVSKLVFVTGGTINARVSDFLSVVPNVCLDKPLIARDLRAFVQDRLHGEAE